MRGNLSESQLLSTSQWVRRLPPATSVLLQVGANTHQKQHADPDPGPLCVSLGWRSVLIEPVPQVFAGLRATYATHESARLELVNAAVCADATAERCTPNAKTQAMWYVDTSNATGNWGTNRSDARCIERSGLYGWVKEIASQSKTHVESHSRLLQWSRSSARRCEACSAELGRPLPPDCVTDMIRNNLRRVDVRCYCMGRELRLKPSEPAVTLLVVDAEGYDYNVLAQYPWRRPGLKPWRVVFESSHLQNADFDSAAELLRSHGYRQLSGGYHRFINEWHHEDAP